MTDTSPSRTRAALELLAAPVIAFGSKAMLDPFIWKYSGPVSLLIVLTVATLYMRHRGESWSELGLRSPGGWKSKLLVLPQTLLAVVAIIGTGVLIAKLGDALGLWDTSVVPEGVEARWGNIQGNLPVYLMWMAIVWTSAAFGEEMFFRAFLITRAERAFKSLPFAPVLALLAAALVFGTGHFYYQGMRGLIVTGMIGLSLGTLYLVYKRNLWPLIIAHGLVDSLAMTALYLDADW